MQTPVVLSHGIATSSERTWRETGWLDLLADAGRPVVPIDLPGHGVNRDVAPPDDIFEWMLGHFPGDQVDAIGFSLGARMQLSLFSRHPQRVRKLVVAGVGRNLFEADAERGKRIRAAIAGEAVDDDPEAQYFATLAREPDIDPAGVHALVASLPPFEPDRLAAITCPVLVVIGDQDFAGPADQLVDALPDATLHVLRNVDHFATPKNFGFLDAGLEFLDAAPSF